MTIDDIITNARDLLQDTDSDSYRYSDARLLRAINNAFADTKRLRPDLLTINDSEIPSYTTTTSDEDFPLDGMYVPAFIDYVVGYVEMSDDEYTVDSRAAQLLTIFTTKMVGG
jgi:hypothetical protein